MIVVIRRINAIGGICCLITFKISSFIINPVVGGSPARDASSKKRIIEPDLSDFTVVALILFRCIIIGVIKIT